MQHTMVAGKLPDILKKKNFSGRFLQGCAKAIFFSHGKKIGVLNTGCSF